MPRQRTRKPWTALASTNLFSASVYIIDDNYHDLFVKIKKLILCSFNTLFKQELHFNFQVNSGFFRDPVAGVSEHGINEVNSHRT